MKLTPKQLFDNPESYLEFLTLATDDEFEDQHFDRKQCPGLSTNGTISSNQIISFREQIQECISAFANTNLEGGIIVLGISKNGEVLGVNHLNENQKNTLLRFNQYLRGHSAISKTIKISIGNENKDVILIFSPYNGTAICETLTDRPSSWLRQGVQNLLMSDNDKERIKRDKHLVDFERAFCCLYNEADIDQRVIHDIRNNYFSGSLYNYSDLELLHNIGAIDGKEDKLFFNNAGYLFFSKYPQRQLSWAYIRLLRFETRWGDNIAIQGQSFDKKFEGNIPTQIRDMRKYFKESSLFKVFQKRAEDGGFIDDPEYPLATIDEAIVNAVVHRDYGIQLPIECKYYKDSFVVESAGRILQRNVDLPDKFTLAEFTLNHMPRNSKILEWLRSLKDEKGAEFVRALSEGTKMMRDEMSRFKLPSPEITSNRIMTVIKFENNLEEREKESLHLTDSIEQTEFSNLFPIIISNKNGSGRLFEFKKELSIILKDALQNNGWFIDRFTFGSLICHVQGDNSIELPDVVSNYLRFYPAYIIQIKEYYNNLYLCVDFTLEVKSILSISELIKSISPEMLKDKRAAVRMSKWTDGKIVEIGNTNSMIYINDIGKSEMIDNKYIIPELGIKLLSSVLSKNRIDFNLHEQIKKHSLLLEKNSSKKRYELTSKMVSRIQETVFPLKYKDTLIKLNAKALHFTHQRITNNFSLQSIPEPKVEFRRHNESSDIREGITKYGTYDDLRKTIEIIPICSSEYRDMMRELLQRIQLGKYKYRGSEKTFSIKVIYNTIISVNNSSEILNECKRLIIEHRNWADNSNLDRLFLIHVPENEYAIDDENSPYYVVKKFLLENGLPSQMVDTPTLKSPDWKDLNLALNISAKCGIKPWVLPDRIPDADFFIGLSYTQSKIGRSSRYLGYATVFNEFGRWEFYTGNTNVFNYDERGKYFYSLTKDTLEKLSLSESPNIFFHYSAKFSREDKEAILNAAREIRPRGIFHFVSINTHHNIRLYDSSIETDGSLSRGLYIITSKNQIILSTTGYNPYRKNLGTPKPLEITIRSYFPNGIEVQNYDLRALAIQVLSLTKLNWASSDSISSEPITTKYAGDIAYLTHAFLRSGEKFNLHPVLEKTTWFI